MAKRKVPNLSDFIGTGSHQFEGSLMEDNVQQAQEPVYYLKISQLCRSRYQPRLSPDNKDLSELEQSIRELGIIQPIVARSLLGTEQYEILAGDRRWRAARNIGLTQIPVVVRDVDDRTAAAIALVENLQRENLNPIEEAQGIRRLVEEFDLSQGQVATLIGKTQSTVSKCLGLLHLDPSVQLHIQEGRLEAGHGKVLLNLDSGLQIRLAELAIEKRWSVRELEHQKAALLAKTASKEKPSTLRKDPDIAHLETRVQERLGAPVRLKYNSTNGKGRIEILFNSVEECDGILERLGVMREES